MIPAELLNLLTRGLQTALTLKNQGQSISDAFGKFRKKQNKIASAKQKEQQKVLNQQNSEKAKEQKALAKLSKSANKEFEKSGEFETPTFGTPNTDKQINEALQQQKVDALGRPITAQTSGKPVMPLPGANITPETLQAGSYAHKPTKTELVQAKLQQKEALERQQRVAEARATKSLQDSSRLAHTEQSQRMLGEKKPDMITPEGRMLNVVSMQRQAENKKNLPHISYTQAQQQAGAHQNKLGKKLKDKRVYKSPINREFVKEKKQEQNETLKDMFGL